jgi:hypothetical protein
MKKNDWVFTNAGNFVYAQARPPLSYLRASLFIL